MNTKRIFLAAATAGPDSIETFEVPINGSEPPEPPSGTCPTCANPFPTIDYEAEWKCPSCLDSYIIGPGSKCRNWSPEYAPRPVPELHKFLVQIEVNNGKECQCEACADVRRDLIELMLSADIPERIKRWSPFPVKVTITPEL